MMNTTMISTTNLSLSYIMLIAFGAGVLGTGIGGAIGLPFRKSGSKAISSVLNFASGVMIAVVCFDLIPEAEALTGNKIYITAIALMLSAAAISILSLIVQKIKKSVFGASSVGSENKAPIEARQAKLARAGLVMALAISLHNFPEGMAIGGTGALPDSFSKAILIASLLALHNIPEGMAITVPMVTGGTSRAKALMWAVAAGGVTVIGAAAGYALGTISPLITAICLASAAGAMLYVTFAEIIPEAASLYGGKTPAIFLLCGILVGMGAIFIAGAY